MKILCLIDSLGPGGAQRQLATLAVGLKKRGHEVRFLVYHPHDHFLPLLKQADIPCQLIQPCSYIKRMFAIRHILSNGWQDVVLTFLEAPCLYTELASIPYRSWGLVVGERSADPQMKSGSALWRRQLHRLADIVVCNSHTNRLMIETAFPFLKRKLCTIYNAVDLKLFHPVSDEANTVCRSNTNVFRIVIAASYHDYKNMINVARALLRLKENKNCSSIVVDWYGSTPTDAAAFKQAEQFVAENHLTDMLRLHSATRDIAGEFSNADAIGLFSLFEGLPNAICEGMASGKPILSSNVCDASNLVSDGINGFLCDPTSHEGIAEIIGRMVALSELERQKMGSESRRMAERLFIEEIVVERYERIIFMVSRRESIASDCNWPSDIPQTAMKTVERWAKGSR